MAPPKMTHIQPRDTAQYILKLTRHTSVVMFSKYTLVGLSIVLILLVFIIPALRSDRGGERLVFSNVPSGTASEPVMVKPLFQSTDSNNQPYRITADKAIQGEDDNVKMDKIQADIALKDGTWIAMMASLGMYHPEKEQLTLPDEVTIYHDGGYEINGQNITMQLKTSVLSSPSPVHAQGPLGTLTADGLTAYITERRAVFAPNVKVVFRP